MSKIKYFINNCFHEFGLTIPFIQDMIIFNGMVLIHFNNIFMQF